MRWRPRRRSPASPIWPGRPPYGQRVPAARWSRPTPGWGPCSTPRSVRCSTLLVDADHVAGRITDREVPHPVRLLGGLLDDLDVTGLQVLEGAVQVLGGQ